MGTDDIVVSAGSQNDILGATSGTIQIVEGSEGQGHLTLQVGRVGGGETIASRPHRHRRASGTAASGTALGPDGEDTPF